MEKKISYIYERVKNLSDSKPKFYKNMHLNVFRFYKEFLEYQRRPLHLSRLKAKIRDDLRFCLKFKESFKEEEINDIKLLLLIIEACQEN